MASHSPQSSAHLYDKSGQQSSPDRNSLSLSFRVIYDEFESMVLNVRPIYDDDLSKRFTTKTKATANDSKKCFNVLLSNIRNIARTVQIKPLAHTCNLVVAIDWMASTFAQPSFVNEVFGIKSLKKSHKETFDSYVKRIHKLLEYLKDSKVSNDVIVSVQSLYGTELSSPYLPTEHFKEFQSLPVDLTETFWTIFNDPYPRSKQEWEERCKTAEQLFGENIDIPSLNMIMKENLPPSSPSMEPLKAQLLSKPAMMRMVKEWNSFGFKSIANNMRQSRKITDSAIRDKLGGVLHGIMQYMAMEGHLKASHTYPYLYRGLYATGDLSALDEYFPLDADGNRTVLKDRSLIATSWNQDVARKLYAERDTHMNQSDYTTRGLLMHIASPAPFVLLEHTVGQDEALLLPGSFTFLKLLETQRTHDVIEVRYKPDFTIMKLYQGVYKLYKKKSQKI